MKAVLDLLNRRNLRAALIVVPAMLAALYLFALAEDRYVSESVVAVRRNGERLAAPEGFAALLAGTGNGDRQDTLLLRSYIDSMDLLQTVDANLKLRQAWSRPRTDWFFRLSPDASREQFLRYWRRQVETTFDDASGLLTVRTQAFDPALAAQLNAEVLLHAERFINESSQQIAREQMRFAEGELRKARQSVHRARDALQAFQAKHGILDPLAQVQASTGLTTELQATLARQEAELKGLLSFLNESAPQVQALRSQIAGTRAQLSAESQRAIVARGGQKLTALAGDYQQLLGELQFAEDTYKIALTAMESARTESTRQLKSLLRVESPTQPQAPEYPRRIYSLAALLVGLLLLYGVVRLVVATIEDHRQ